MTHFQPYQNSSQIRFWAYGEHYEWREHYIPGSGNWRLAFCDDFLKQELLPGSTSGGFRCELVLTRLKDDPAAPRFITPLYVAYEPDWQPVSVLDLEWQPRPARALQHYFYADHHCPCHRLQDAEAAGYVPMSEDYEPGVVQDECGAIRFSICRIWSPELPDLVLYSETMTELDLNASLGTLPIA